MDAEIRTRSSPSATLEDWAREWLSRLDRRPDVVATRHDGIHAALLAGALPASLIISSGEQGSPRSEPYRVHIRELQHFGSTIHRALTLGLEVFKANPPADLLGGSPTYAGFEDELARCRRIARVEQATLARRAPIWLDNVERNVPRVLGALTTADLIRSASRSPVLVVGAGPSLGRLLPQLEDLARGALLIASTSALKPLASVGVVPDAAVIIEGRDCRHHVEGLPSTLLSQTVLFAESSTHPAHLELPFRQRIVFHGPAGKWLEPWSGRGSIVPTGGNVGTAALVIAWLLGGDPICMAGLDFALDGERYYAHGAGSRADEHGNAEAIEVTGWGGEAIKATLELACYREQTEDVIKLIGDRARAPRFVCLADGGARIAGVERDAAAVVLAGRPLLDRRLDSVVRDLERRRGDRTAGTAGRAEALCENATRLVSSLEQIAHDPRGPALALATRHPHDSLAMVLLAPALLESRNEGVNPAEQRARATARTVARFRATVDRAVDLARRYESASGDGSRPIGFGAAH